jgi:uncharacterized membrane protein
MLRSHWRLLQHWRVPHSGLTLPLALAFLFAANLFCARPAAAALTACNKTSYVIIAAIGFDAHERSASRGWYQIEPGQCRALIETKLEGRVYYTFARSLTAYSGEVQYFAGSEAFCADPGAQDFNITGRSDCERRGFTERRFIRLDTGGSPDWTTSFTEAHEYTLEEARIAGVQRLLQDIGLSDARIDGMRGSKTSRAVQAFKQKHGLGDDPSLPSSLYGALIAAAEAQPRTAGFKFCNETGELAWGAVGYVGAGDPVSTGWFKIPPKGCVDAIKERLRATSYYSYAESDGKHGDLLSWGGEEKFCVTDDRFVIRGRENCEKRGYSTMGFMRIETRGSTELVQTLTPEGALTKRSAN